jgi:hypothetical protein
MFGIIATPIQIAQGIYYLKCIYDRVSPQANKRKKFKCNFNFLRISEDVTEGILDTTYIPATAPTPPNNGNGNAPAKPATTKATFQPGEPEISEKQLTIDTLNTNMPQNRVTLMDPANIKAKELFK